MAYVLSNLDVRTLQVFLAVVECKGFSNAQSVLNTSQPAISTQMSKLEARLGFRLCERGRNGFKLTPKGEQVYEEAKTLFRAHERFQNFTSGLKNSLAGYLRIAVTDSVINDRKCPVIETFRLYSSRLHETNITLKIMRTDEMERALISRDIDIAIGVFNNQLPSLIYQKIYDERNELMCGDAHPIFDMTDEDEIQAAAVEARKTTRALLDGGDILLIEGSLRKDNAVVFDIEATALLVLSGGYIGFLPTHFCKHWVEEGRMKAVLPERYYFNSPFSVVTREKTSKSLIFKRFQEDLQTAISGGEAPTTSNAAAASKWKDRRLQR